MKSIGIDIGTTTISLVVLDTEKKMVLESRTISNGTFIETGNAWERIQEPVKIIEKTVGVLNELLAAHKDVETIGLTGQMHGIVYLEEVRSRNLTVRALFRKYTKKQDLPCPQALDW